MYSTTYYKLTLVDTGVIIEDDEGEVGAISTVGRLGGLAAVSATTSNLGNDNSYANSAVDLNSAAKAIEKMINDLFGEVAKFADG
jgi:hypothetical protein